MDTRKSTKDGQALLMVDLAQAIAADRIEVVYQPQFACRDGRIVGAEALARWRHERLGAVDARSLLDLAGQAGLCTALSQRVWQRALVAAREWPDTLHLSLNVTAGELGRPGFAADFLVTLEASGLSPGRLVLEITENAPLADVEGAADRLRRLTQRGVRLALDDFGAGYCDFRYLKLLPLAALKLDRSMVSGVTEDARDLAVLRGLVTMADALGLEVVAEGIETLPQREAVAREGCTSWQGFLGAAPMGGVQFSKLVQI